MTTPVSRVVRGARGRDWIATAGELVLIVVGILVALWVDGLVERRGDQRVERESLLSSTAI